MGASAKALGGDDTGRIRFSVFGFAKGAFGGAGGIVEWSSYRAYALERPERWVNEREA